MNTTPGPYTVWAVVYHLPQGKKYGMVFKTEARARAVARDGFNATVEKIENVKIFAARFADGNQLVFITGLDRDHLKASYPAPRYKVSEITDHEAHHINLKIHTEHKREMAYEARYS